MLTEVKKRFELRIIYKKKQKKWKKQEVILSYFIKNYTFINLNLRQG